MRTAKTADGDSTLSPKTKHVNPKKRAAKAAPFTPATGIPDLRACIYTVLFYMGNIPVNARSLHILYAHRAKLREIIAALRSLEVRGNVVMVKEAPVAADTTWRFNPDATPPKPEQTPETRERELGIYKLLDAAKKAFGLLELLSLCLADTHTLDQLRHRTGGRLAIAEACRQIGVELNVALGAAE